MQSIVLKPTTRTLMPILENAQCLRKLFNGRNQEGARRSHGQEIEKGPGKDPGKESLSSATQSDEEVGPFCAQQIALPLYLEFTT